MTKVNTAQAPITDWQSYTPTFGNMGTVVSIDVKWRRVGDTINIVGAWTTGANAAGFPTITIPSGLAIDLAKTPAGGMIVGTRHRRPANVSDHAYIYVQDATTIILGNVNASTQFNASDSIQIVVTSLPISSWSSNVVFGDRAVEEYSSNSNTADADDTTSFVSGINGSLCPGTLTNIRTRRVRFQTPIQPTDKIDIEVLDNAGRWVEVGQTYAVGTNGYPVNSFTFTTTGTGTGSVGMGWIGISGNSTDINVMFGAIYYAALDGVNTQGWGLANAQGNRWRVRKVAGGGMVGYPISARNVTGDVSGTAIPTGNIGEIVNFDFLSPAMPAAGNIVNAFSKTLQPGSWLIHGGASVSSGSSSVAGTDNYFVVSISSTSATENSSNRVASTIAPGGSNAERGATTHGFVNLSVATTIFVTIRHNYTTLGTSAITNNFAPRPQAIRIA